MNPLIRDPLCTAWRLIQKFADPGVNDCTIFRNQCFVGDLIVQVEFWLPFFNEVQQERRDVLGVHLACVVWNGCWQIGRAEQRHSLVLCSLVGLRQLTVTTFFGCHVDDY